MLDLRVLKFKNEKEMFQQLMDFAKDVNCYFSGENGIEYASQEAIDAGCESDAEYLISQLEKNEEYTAHQKMHKFVSEMFDDQYRYGDFVIRKYTDYDISNLHTISPKTFYIVAYEILSD